MRSWGALQVDVRGLRRRQLVPPATIPASGLLIGLEANGQLLDIGVGLAAVVLHAVDKLGGGGLEATLAGKIGEVTGLQLALGDQLPGRLGVDIRAVDLL